MFAALAEAGVNMKMITTGDIKISVLVDKTDGVKALRAVHQAFGLDKPRPGAGHADRRRAAPFQQRPAPAVADVDGSATCAADRQRLASMEDIVVSDVLLEHRPGPHHDLRSARPARQLLDASSRRWPRPASSST